MMGLPIKQVLTLNLGSIIFEVILYKYVILRIKNVSFVGLGYFGLPFA